jgi:hypothetical protein
MKIVKIVKIVSLAVVAVALIGATSSGKRNMSRHFLGLWEGVDVNDGSLRTVSITDQNRDGVLEVASRDTFWTLCDGDRGLELASGDVGYDGVLTTSGTITCFEAGSELEVMQTYEISRRERTLFATPLGTGLMPVTLHRVSP